MAAGNETGHVDVHALAMSITAADEAGLLVEADVARLSSAVLAVVQAPPSARMRPALCPGCCRQAAWCDGKSVVAKVLGTDGLRRVRHVPARCSSRACPLRGKLVWANFVAESKGVHRWLATDAAPPCFWMLSPHFGVTRAWLQQFGKRLSCQHASFWGEAEVHWHSDCGIARSRLKKLIRDAWLKFTWLQRLCERTGKGLDKVSMYLSWHPEELLSSSWDAYCELMQRRRSRDASQYCGTVVRLVLDGHQKLTRRTCQVPLCRWVFCSALGVGALTPCDETPWPGSHCCATHSRKSAVHRPSCMQPGEEIVGVKVQDCVAASLQSYLQLVVRQPGGLTRRFPVADVDWPYVLQFLVSQASPRRAREPTVSAAASADIVAEPPAAIDEELTLAEVLALACQTHKQGHGDRARALPSFRRSGGFLVACTSNGLIADIQEFCGAESVSQRYLFVARLKSSFPDLAVLVHDDACHLRRFADKRAHQSSFAKKLAFPEMMYAIDKFHARGHVDEWCLNNCHPRCEAVKEAIEGVNTSICEITFTWAARFKHSFRKMGKYTASFFMNEMVQMRNDRMLREIQGGSVASADIQHREEDNVAESESGSSCSSSTSSCS